MTTEVGRLVSEAVVREIERAHVQRGWLCVECADPETGGGVDYPCPPVQMAREIRRLWATCP